MKHKQKNGSYSLSECGDEIDVGKKATDNYCKAANKLNELIKQQKTKYSNYVMIQDDDEYGFNDPTIHPPYLGQIETNMSITQLMLESTELSEQKNKTVFLEMLYNHSLDIDTFFRGITSYPWEEYMEFISTIFSRSHECLTKITTNLSYVTASSNIYTTNMIAKIRNLVPKFNKCFLQDIDIPWMECLGKLKQPSAKADYLRKLFKLYAMYSFGWLKLDENLPNHQQKLLQFQEIITSSQDKETFETKDKIVYVNVFFALKYTKYDNIRLNGDLVLGFLKELVRNGVDISEPYLFYLMLIWPTEISDDIDQDIFLCIEKLKELESLNVKRSHGYKPPVLFFLGKGKGADKLLPFHSNKAKQSRRQIQEEASRFRGKLDGESNVEITSHTGSVISVRMADLRFRALNKIEEVSFLIGFTFGGPVACDYELTRRQDEALALRERVDTMISDESIDE